MLWAIIYPTFEFVVYSHFLYNVDLHVTILKDQTFY
jgi:hypothetical protein